MEKFLVKNGYSIDWDTRELTKKDILIEGGVIKQIDTKISVDNCENVIDAQGNFVSAGFIDMHVHLREPGFTQKETIETGTKAAARGGFTTVACMPNTRPVTDSADIVKRIIQRSKETEDCRVLPIAAITTRQLGEELTDMRSLKDAGAVALSDDGVGIQTSRVMKAAMKKAKALGLPIIAHCEDNSLAKGGCVHDGFFARKYGITGIPSEAESVQIARDILLAEHTGVHYHVCHMSTKESVRLVREAKARGQHVTAEVTPHHLLLCEDDIPGLDSMYKMNPPLRSKEDQQALLEGLLDGTIDIIATDHAPHTTEEKGMGMEKAPFGIVGLETAFPLLYTNLVLKGVLSLPDLVGKMTLEPKRIFGLPYGLLEEGAIADITIIDLDKESSIHPDQFISKGKNTPFSGWVTKGWPVMTFMNGRKTWEEKGLIRVNTIEARR